MFVALTIFSNEKSVCPPTLLKIESTTDILIGQIEKYQSSCFKEHLWNIATARTKSMYFKCMPQNRLTETLNVTIFVPSFLNSVWLGVLYFLRRSMYRVLNERATDILKWISGKQWKHGLSVSYPKLGWESCCTLPFSYPGLYKKRSTKEATNNFQRRVP